TRGALSGVTDNANGTYTATLTSSTTVGYAAVSGTVNGSAMTSSGGVSFVTGPPAKYLVTSSSSNPTVGSTVTITAQLADTNNNSVASTGRTVTWSSTGGGSFAAGTSTTDSSGVATVAFTVSSVAGTTHN